MKLKILFPIPLREKMEKYKIDPSCIFYKNLKKSSLTVSIRNLKYAEWYKVTGINAMIFCELVEEQSLGEILSFAKKHFKISNNTLPKEIEHFLIAGVKNNLILKKA